MRILLVEDDVMIGQLVADELKDSAHAVDWIKDGQTALEAVFDAEYDCALLDLGLPKVDGIKVLSHWRSQKLKTPVIILTARDDVGDRVLGLDHGADDYVIKPFEMQELKARIRAVTRRNLGDPSGNVVKYGTLSVDLSTHLVSITQKDGVKEIELTQREFALLEALMARPGAVLSRDRIEERIYNWDEEIESNAVEYIIHTLRRKIGPEYVKNVRGVGWKVNKVELEE